MGYPPAERAQVAAEAAEAARKAAAYAEADALRIAIENVEQKIVCEQDAAKKADQYVKDTLFNSAAEKNEARRVVEAHHAVVEELEKTKASHESQRKQKLAEA